MVVKPNKPFNIHYLSCKPSVLSQPINLTIPLHLLSAPAPTTNTGPVLSQVELDDKWEDISSDLSAIFQGRAEGELPTDVAPFDAASQVEDEQHR